VPGFSGTKINQFERTVVDTKARPQKIQVKFKLSVTDFNMSDTEHSAHFSQ